MDTKDVTIQLMKDLVASDTGLLPYTLYKRYGVTPIVLIQIVKRLQDKGFLQMVENNRLLLTSEGRDNAEGFIASLSKTGRVRMDSAYFLRIAGFLLDRKTPFLPSKKFFELYNREGEKNG